MQYQTSIFNLISISVFYKSIFLYKVQSKAGIKKIEHDIHHCVLKVLFKLIIKEAE